MRRVHASRRSWNRPASNESAGHRRGASLRSELSLDGAIARRARAHHPPGSRRAGSEDRCCRRRGGSRYQRENSRSSTCPIPMPPPSARWNSCAKAGPRALMKGKLHTDELLGAVVSRSKRAVATDTPAEPPSSPIDVPSYPRTLFVHRMPRSTSPRISRSSRTSSRTPLICAGRSAPRCRAPALLSASGDGDGPAALDPRRGCAVQDA